MTGIAMANPLRKIKKIRSLDEVLTRGGQAISAYREQRRGKWEMPTDEEFVRLVDPAQFGDTPIIAETLWRRFYQNGKEHFFASFRDLEMSKSLFCETFGQKAVDGFITAAENIVEGRIDLLGLKNLYVGTEIDWHREPLSAMRSPLKHWKEFDDLDTRETGNKKIVWELNRHQHFFTLGVAFWLTGDEKFARTFTTQLDSWMDQNPPGLGVNWSSSLEIAFRAMSWVWAFHFFRNSDNFTPDLFLRGLKQLHCHGRHIEQYLSTYYSPNTHLTGEALGLYYLGTQLPFLERSHHWRKLGNEIMVNEISKQVLSDGVYFEQSTWYQRYTVDFFNQFVMLRSLHGDSYYTAGAAAIENGLERALDVMLHITMPGGETPLIGDDDGGRTLPLTSAAADDFRGTLAVGSIIFDRGDLKRIGGAVPEDVFWLMGPTGLNSYDNIAAVEPKAASKGFDDGGYFVMRDGWEATDNYLLVDCGPVGSLSGGHGHADALSIELAIQGKTMLVDSGTYTYHESRELRDYFRSTTAHNTLVIDGVSSSEPGGTFGWKTSAQAAKRAWIAEDRFDFFEGTHDGYQRLAAPATHTRSILFIKNDYWIMRDVVETTGTHKYSLNFHFSPGVCPAIGDEGRWVGDEAHRLFTFGDSGAWQQKESWVSANHANKVNAPFLRFMSKGEGTQEFFTFILPAQDGADPPEVSEVPTAAARAFVIKYRGYTDLFVFNDEPGLVANGLFDSSFKYTWARLSVDQSIPDEFVLIDGGELRIGADQMIDPEKWDFAAARRFGNELYLKTSLGRSKRPLTPKG